MSKLSAANSYKSTGNRTIEASISSQILYAEALARLQSELGYLSDRPDETPEASLLALWHTAARQPKSVKLASETTLPSLDETGVITLKELVDRHIKGEPLAHLTGREQFMGIELLAGPDALVPREETELLGYAALDLLNQLVAERAGQNAARSASLPLREQLRPANGIVMLDICTGAGNLAIALAHYQPTVKVFASDLSDDAIRLARRNVSHLGLQQQVHLRQSDLFKAFENETFYGAVDLVTCNPPYISSEKVATLPNGIARYEPRLAFDGGPLGINLLLRLMREAPRYLRPGGWLAFEVGLGQGPAIVRRLLRNDNAYSAVKTVNDHNGEIRAILARRGYEPADAC